MAFMKYLETIYVGLRRPVSNLAGWKNIGQILDRCCFEARVKLRDIDSFVLSPHRRRQLQLERHPR
jgi:hypothetical protein